MTVPVSLVLLPPSDGCDYSVRFDVSILFSLVGLSLSDCHGYSGHFGMITPVELARVFRSYWYDNPARFGLTFGFSVTTILAQFDVTLLARCDLLPSAS